jgi:iron complex outermembrane receptor protein
MRKLSLLCASSALFLPSLAFAQSTGSIEVEKEESIVVTGTRLNNGVEGIVVPDAAKAQAVLTQENISRQSAGQSILNTINIIPGVNFTNNDPYGSSGGSIRIRGFDGNRISLTFDGLPLNDTGNYAIFSNQQLDPELIEQVSVNLGQTEVDSPTASAAGGTVNYRTLIPRSNIGGRVSGSVGEDNFRRVFGMIETGDFWDGGPRGFVSASRSRNDLFRGPGKIEKQQYNARIYQPLAGRDFISISGHYNQNRNNFYRNPNINDIRSALVNPAFIPASGNPTPPAGTPIISFSNPARIGGSLNEQQTEAIYNINNFDTCTLTTPGARRQNDGGGTGPNGTGTAASGGTANIANASSCTNFFNLRINPSNTGNVRISSRFSLADNLILTVDPSYQYVLANGGGTQVLEESAVQLGGNGAAAGTSAANGFVNAARTGIDLNGDGDVQDAVRLYTPNNTNTNRYGLTSSLIWNVTPEHRLRLAYTFDYGRHRQTGEYGFLDSNGNPENVFGGRNGRPVLSGAGQPVQGRDRFSIASLHQIAGQYVGRLLDDKLRLEIGVRAPFFRRELNQNCFTNAGGGNVTAGGIGVGGGFTLCAPNLTLAQVQALIPRTSPGVPSPSESFIAPFKQDYKFDKVLPNVGAVFQVLEGLSVFGSYAKGFSAPRTDNLYRRTSLDIAPETTDAFDAGVRFTRRNIQAQLTGWNINYQNRILTSFDPDLGFSIDRNVGKVKSHGFDGSVAFKPIEAITLYAFGSYIDAKFAEDVRLGTTLRPTGTNTVPAGTPIFAPTRGRMVAETPEWQYGGRAQVEFGPVELGIQGKFVDDRFATDVNDVIVPSYALFDADARFNLKFLGLERTYLQLNMINLFDERYIGGIGTQINAGQICPAGATCSNNTSNPNFTPGAPRTFLATLNVGF